MGDTGAMGWSRMAGLAGVLVLLGTATAVRAQGPNNVISVCVNQSNGAMRMLLNNIPSPPCSAGEEFVQWNIQGPQGPPGSSSAPAPGKNSTAPTVNGSGTNQHLSIWLGTNGQANNETRLTDSDLVEDANGEFGMGELPYPNTGLAVNGGDRGILGQGCSGHEKGKPVGQYATSTSTISEFPDAGTTPYGLRGECIGGDGVQGESETDSGLKGTSKSGAGVKGESNDGRGVEGDSKTKGGVVGLSDEGNGVTGQTNSSTAAGIVGIGHRAAIFNGGVAVEGDLLIDGKILGQEVLGRAKFFRIDDPIDPENKYLNHVSIESSEMMNLYTGDATLDAQGEAVVRLPDWFEALNKDFRYQLTAIAAPGPNLYIAEKVNHNRFKIAGGAPEMEVSWQITGVRHDPWAEANPPQVEEEKTGKARGTYLDPSAYNQPIEKGLEWAENPYFHRELQAIWERDYQRAQPAKDRQPVRENAGPTTKAAGGAQERQTDIAGIR